MVFSMNELSHAASSQTMLYQDFRFEDCVSYLLLCAKLGNGQRISFFFFWIWGTIASYYQAHASLETFQG